MLLDPRRTPIDRFTDFMMEWSPDFIWDRYEYVVTYFEFRHAPELWKAWKEARLIFKYLER